MVSLLSNPLATAEQLSSSPSQADGLPASLEVTLRWAGLTLLQSAGLLLRLPQPAIATAQLLYQRFFLLRSFRTFSVLSGSQASLFLASKLSEVPVAPRSIINVTTYLLSTTSPSPISPLATTTSSYVSEHAYHLQRTRLLAAETELLKAVGYDTHAALPYALAVNYAQALDCLQKSLLQRAFAYLSDVMFSPSCVYLTHQPNALAAAALYLAARDEAVKLPECWWEVFDVEREDLGFLVAGMGGVEGFVKEQRERWRELGGVWELEQVEELLRR
ncbi:cyclin-like protein [Tricharina praecox]|uniref:cyclin-like protein n=1 Tax=Tricharina praecox TaxID=43433 RepID=UPI00222008E4|nr:cyclin-like protein [Tricharina praecox]KAI5856282.1 cyclin-like protein [Tricharina praecox]